MRAVVSGLAISAALSAAVVLASASGAARAQESHEQASKEQAAEEQTSKEDAGFQRRLFGRALEKQALHACFTRVYDTGHLAQHPQQNVRTMLLLVRGNTDANQPRYALRLGVSFRKSGARFESAGDCGSIRDTTDTGGSGGVAHCGVDCDGGSIDVAIKDVKSVLVSIPLGARIWRPNSNDDSDQAKRFGSDDKVFRLDRTALSECVRLADDDKEKAALRRGH